MIVVSLGLGKGAVLGCLLPIVVYLNTYDPTICSYVKKMAGKKALKIAIESGKVDKIEDALRDGCKVTKDDLLAVITGSFGSDHLAVVDRISDLTKVLVVHVKSAIDTDNTDIVLCLMKKTSASLKKLHCVAAEKRNIVVFRELMNRGDRCAYDALRCAIGSGCLDIVQDINEQKLIRSLSPSSQISSAIYYNHKDVIDYLMDKYWATLSPYGCSDVIRCACTYKRYHFVKDMVDSYPIKKVKNILGSYYIADSIIELAKYDIPLAKKYVDYFSSEGCYSLRNRIIKDSLWKWMGLVRNKSPTKIPQMELASYIGIRNNMFTNTLIDDLKQYHKGHDVIDNFIDFLKNY